MNRIRYRIKVEWKNGQVEYIPECSRFYGVWYWRWGCPILGGHGYLRYQTEQEAREFIERQMIKDREGASFTPKTISI